MKDIDNLLHAQKPRPKRPLKADFTDTVVHVVEQRPQKLWNPVKLLRSMPTKRLASLGALGFVITSAGTVAALALWNKPVVTPTISDVLPNGNRIVGVDAQNCMYFDALDGKTEDQKTEKIYYEVRKDAKITNEQLVNSIEATCVENLGNNAVSAIVSKLDQPAPGMFSDGTFRIDAISRDSLTVTYHKTILSRNDLDTRIPTTMTLTNFANKLYVRENMTDITYSDLKVGDSIKMLLDDTSVPAGASTESALTEQAARDYFPWRNPSVVKVLGIVKVLEPITTETELYNGIIHDYVRTEPCDTNPTGFCRAYEFDSM